MGRRARARRDARDRAERGIGASKLADKQQITAVAATRAGAGCNSDSIAWTSRGLADGNPSAGDTRSGAFCSSPHSRATMASTAALGGRDRAVGGGKGAGAGGPRGQRIVTPNGEGRGGGDGGGGGGNAGRVVDGRGVGGRGGGGRAGRCPADVKEWEWDLDEACRKICAVLKQDCKVGREWMYAYGGC